MKGKRLLLAICLLLLIILSACSDGTEKSNDVIILFTNDVHCGIDQNIGYDGLSAYKTDLQQKYNYVVLADCGDFVQGEYEGMVSKGEYIIDIMNAVGYDYAIFGNHEFDYGAEQLKHNVENSTAQFLNCNISYIGSGEDWLKTDTKPYEVKSYGDIKVGFIGVTTPWTINSSTPKHFMEDNKYAYDFSQKEGARHFYDVIQNNVDLCRAEGADYVIVLSHLGTDLLVDTPFTSVELAQNTSGIDVILDAHSHVEASCWVYENSDGKDVLISSTGTKLENIGKVVLTQDGTVSVGYIDKYEKKDSAITEKIAQIRQVYQEQMNAVVSHIETDLLCVDSDGIRMVRSRELPIGDFVADAYRIIGEADIGMCNGGGIRADLEKGDITYDDIIAVNPFGNTLCVVKVKGSEIVDMLEYFYRYVQADYKKDGVAFGEDGSFQQVSGLKFTIDTSVETSVVVDETDALVKVNGVRRVKDVMILKDGNYVPIELDKTYTLASHNYMIKDGGSGMSLFLKDHELVIDEAISDYQILIDYLALLNGDLSQYNNVDERIIVE